MKYSFLFFTLFLFTPFVLFSQLNHDSLSITETSEVMSNEPEVEVSGSTTHDEASVQPQPSVKPFVIRDKTSFSVMALIRSLFGIFVLILIAWLFSSNRKAVSWRVVTIGLLIQVCLAFGGVLFIPAVELTFEFIGKIFVKVLDFTKIGSAFLFNDLMNIDSFGYVFALQILPTIIFFSALTSVLFYLGGVIQKVVWALAWLLTKALKISGAESLSVAGQYFLGSNGSSSDDKAYLPKMNNSEML